MNFKSALFGATMLGACTLVPVAAHAEEAAVATATSDGTSTAAAPQVAPPPADAAAPTEQAGKPAPTEIVVTGRFLATGAYSATKQNISVLDTPASVSAYTNAFMKSIQTNNVADLYRYMTGVQRAGNTGYDLTLRGFTTSANDRNAIMVDGMPGLAVRFGSPPTVGTDHVELVKGPASLLYGQAQPGGFVNIITKKPQAAESTTIETQATEGLSDNDPAKGDLTSIDSTGPLTDDAKLLYRFIAQAGYNGGYRTDSYERPIFIAPSMTWLLAPKTTATVLLEYRETTTHYDTYLVAPHRNVNLIAPIDTTYQEPGDYLKETGKTASLLLSHELAPGWKVNLSYRYVDHEDVARGLDVVAVANNFTQVTRRARGQVNDRGYVFGDSNVTGDFNLGPFRNQLIAGLSTGRETADLNRLQFYNLPASGNVNVINPTYGLVGQLGGYPLVNPTTPANLNDRFSVSDAFGAYASDLITLLPQLKAQIGVRYSKEDLSITERKLVGVPEQFANNADTLPSFALLYEPSTHLSFYTSYSTSFVPVAPSNIDINGKYTFVPTTANSIEGGVKASFFNRRLTFTLADFDIHRKNVVNTFACTLGTCSDQIGGAESKGVELEFDVTPIRNWQISGGYSYVDARVIKSDVPVQIGAHLTNAPENNGHVWTRYDFDSGILEGAGVGFGATYVGLRKGFLPTVAQPTELLPLPRYIIADAAIYYHFLDRYDLTLKVTNLFDKVYYESAGFTADINIVPGEPRTLTLAVRARF